MAITRKSDLSNMLLAGSDAQFNKAAKKPRRQYWKDICTVKNQPKEIGNYDTIGNLSQAEEHVEGSAVTFDKIEYNNRTSITSKVYDKAVAATLESQIFDQYDVVTAQFGEPLVAALNIKKEHVVADVWNGVFTDTGADGVALASNSHPLKNNALLYNDNLTTGALSNESLRAAKNMFNFIYNQAGDYFDTQPTHLLIHPNKMFQALELLNSVLTAWQLSNTKNVLQDVAPIKIISNPYLTYTVATDVSPWFMLDLSLDGAGCILQSKKALALHTWFERAELDSLKGVAYEVYGSAMVAPGYGFIASSGA
jgi:phage major head subunit gpT-like protein